MAEKPTTAIVVTNESSKHTNAITGQPTATPIFSTQTVNNNNNNNNKNNVNKFNLKLRADKSNDDLIDDLPTFSAKYSANTVLESAKQKLQVFIVIY